MKLSQIQAQQQQPQQRQLQHKQPQYNQPNLLAHLNLLVLQHPATILLAALNLLLL